MKKQRTVGVMDNKKRWNNAAIASLLIPLPIIVLTFFLDGTDFYERYSNTLERFWGTAILIWYMLAIFSLISIWRRPGQRGITFVLCGYVLLMLIPFPFPRPNTHYKQIRCASHLKMIGTALHQYAQDHGGKLPPTDRWNGVVTKIDGSNGIMYCPKAENEKPAFAINHALTGIDLTRLQDPGEIVMVFECKPGSDRVGGVDIAEFRHAGGCNVCFADGHIKWISEKDLPLRMNLPITLKKPTSTHDQQNGRYGHEETRESISHG